MTSRDDFYRETYLPAKGKQTREALRAVAFLLVLVGYVVLCFGLALYVIPWTAL